MERIKEIPAITFDAVQLFTEHDSAKLAALMEEEKRQEAAQRDAWRSEEHTSELQSR